MKSYTDLSQSKKLAEMLPIESADMYYFLDPTQAGNIYHIVTPQIDFGVKTREPEYNKGDIPCWSLAALLGVIRETIGYTIYGINNVYMSCDLGDKPWKLETEVYDNEVDACIDMIIKLHELNLL